MAPRRRRSGKQFGDEPALFDRRSRLGLVNRQWRIAGSISVKRMVPINQDQKQLSKAILVYSMPSFSRR